MNTTQIRTEAHTSTWCGRKGTNTIYRKGGPNGVRVAAMVWADDPGMAVVRLIEGDGRTANFTEHRSAVVWATQAADLAAKWLA